MNSKFLLGALIIFTCGQSLAAELPTKTPESERVTAQILEKDVSVGTIQQVFKNAYMKTSLDKDGDLWVEVENNFKVMIQIDSSRKLLNYRLTFGFKKPEADTKKLVFANKMNSEIIMARFSVPESDASTLVVDYFLPYEEEVPAFQIVSAIRLLAGVSIKAVRKYDVGDLIE